MGETIIPWRQLGELLVERNVISDSALELALAEQETTLEPLGEILLAQGLVSVSELTDALVDQLGLELGEHASIGSSSPGEAARTRRDSRAAKVVREGGRAWRATRPGPTPGIVAETGSNEDDGPKRRREDMRAGGELGEPQLAGEPQRLELAERELAQARAVLEGREATIDVLAHELAQARVTLADRQATIDDLAHELEQLRSGRSKSPSDLPPTSAPPDE
jgi:uncharacterized coiled-coil protein SlyX